MRSLLPKFLRLCITLLACSLAANAGADPAISDKEPTTRQENRDRVDDAVKRLVDAKDWQEVSAVQQELAGMGEAAVKPLVRQAKRHEDDEVRLHCFELLTKHFSKYAAETIARHGLSDESENIRYHCAWYVGDLKLYAAHHSLRRLMEDSQQPESVRNAATKSLAQLGELDVICRLITMIASDYYMPRYMGNLGAEALTGKDLDDFNGYEYSEGAFVSGGNEVVRMYMPVDYHEKVAKRHQAIADYCKWLEKKRPEIFKHLYAPW